MRKQPRRGEALFHLQHESLEVFALRMVDIDGVVGRLMNLVEDADVATTLCGSSEDGQAELVFIHGLRATEGEENAAGLYLLEGDGIEARVALEGIAQRILMFGKSGRVENDEVVLVAHVLKILEGILAVGMMARAVAEIERYIGIDQIHGLGAAIDAVYEFSAATQGIDAEAARVAKHVQHLAVVAVVFQQRAVLTLIHEEARLLAAQPVDVEAQSVLGGHGLQAGCTANEESVFLIEVSLEGECGFALIIYIMYARHLAEYIGNDVALEVHSHGVCLHHGGVGIHIHHEAWQSVSLAMDEAIGIVVVSYKSQALAHTIGLLQATHPEGAVDGLLAEGKHAHCDGSNLVVPGGDIVAFGIEDIYHLPFFYMGRQLVDSS